MTLIITRGLPGSGKTTWALDEVAKDLQRRSRVNRDDLRRYFGGEGVLEHGDEQRITELQRDTVTHLLKAGRLVIVDDTNLRARHARAWADLAREVGVAFDVEDFTHVPVETCIERDRARGEQGGRTVGEQVIRDMHARYLAAGPLPKVEPTALIETLVSKYVPDETLPPAWIVDVDGTLALMGGRGPYDWHRVGEDEPNASVVTLVQWLASSTCNLEWDPSIVIVSGRDGSCLSDTLAWLDRHGVPYDEVHMRAAGDQRKDSIVKAELFWREIAPKWNVLGVIDDRQQVVDMWRSLGLMCAQVAPGDF